MSTISPVFLGVGGAYAEVAWDAIARVVPDELPSEAHFRDVLEVTAARLVGLGPPVDILAARV
jgi:hypothetical protein